MSFGVGIFDTMLLLLTLRSHHLVIDHLHHGRHQKLYLPPGNGSLLASPSSSSLGDRSPSPLETSKAPIHNVNDSLQMEYIGSPTSPPFHYSNSLHQSLSSFASLSYPLSTLQLQSTHSVSLLLALHPDSLTAHHVLTTTLPSIRGVNRHVARGLV